MAFALCSENEDSDAVHLVATAERLYLETLICQSLAPEKTLEVLIEGLNAFPEDQSKLQQSIHGLNGLF